MASNITRLWDGSNSIATAGMTYQDDGSTAHLLISGARFKIAKPPADVTLSEIPREVVTTAVEVHNDLALKTYSATTNPNLSSMGRANALQAPQKLALMTIAQCCVSIKRFRESIDRREEKLYAVPPLNPALAGDAIRDWEARKWYDEQPPATQGEIIAAACMEAGGDALIAALLRGPFPKWNKRTVDIKAAWEAARRNSNVTEAEAIDAQRAAADWAFEQLSLMASMVRQLCGTWGNDAVLKVLVDPQCALDSTGHEIFGYSEREARMARTNAAGQVAAAVLAAA